MKIQAESARPEKPTAPLSELVRTSLAERAPRLIQGESKLHAAVAMLIHEPSSGPEIFFIERAAHPHDPWSGNLAFPGGRIDPGDQSRQAAAERETREEVSYDPGQADLLGQLDDIGGAYLPIVISCFIYRLRHQPEFIPNEEVADLFWVPLSHLIDRDRYCRRALFWQGQPREINGIDLFGDEKPLLWGITYRLVTQILHRIDLIPAHLARPVDD